MKRTSTGRRSVPIRALIYGDPGTGKTTFCAGAPDVTILDLERGSSHLDVSRIEVDTWDEVLEVVRDTKRGTLAIDSLSKLQEYVTDKVLGPNRNPGANLVNFGNGFGEGWELALTHWREFISACERCPASILMTAHTVQKPYSDPTGLTYDRWHVALNDKISATTQRSVDYTLFARFDNATRRTEAKKTVGIIGERVLETAANTAWLAKHRGTIPDQLPLEWDAFASAVEADRFDASATLARLATLVASLDVDDVTRTTMRETIEAAANDSIRLAAIERRIQQRINETKKEATA